MANPSVDVTVDDVLLALSNLQRRKLMVSLLADSSPAAPGSTGIDLPANGADYHNHLPKLDEYGLIDWNRETDVVTRGPNFGAAEEVLEFLAEHDDDLRSVEAPA